MKHFILLMFLFGGALALAAQGKPPATQDDVLVRGPGIETCKEVTREPWWKDEKDLTPIAGYILGFVSATVNKNMPDILPGGTNKDIVELVYKQCLVKPTDSVYYAVSLVVDRLMRSRVKSDPVPPKLLPPNKTQDDYKDHPLKPGEERF